MCGLNGVLRLTPEAPAIDRAELVRVRDSMKSRGPDGAGEWLDPSGRVGFGHRRLAIIDLSAAGAQPMHSADGRLTIVFNGEIYNYRELREALAREGVPLRSASDTEVILALYERDGAAALGRLRGMFALALWDARAGRLTLARDLHGVKPLYYAVANGVLRFASQVKALEVSGAVSTGIDDAGLAGFLMWGAVPEPLTIRPGVAALPAGHLLEIGASGVPEPRPWTADAAPGRTPELALSDSVAAHLVADVPVGVFLSAGLDSALIAALARRLLPEPPTTLTLAFDRFAGSVDDEAPLAAQIARRLGTRHVEHRLGDAEIEALWPGALAAMDQPSIDGFNTFLVSRAAAAHGLKVVLSGLGGDELFGSYPSFRDVPRWTRWAARGAAVPGLRRAWPRLARAQSRPKLAGLLRHGATLGGAYALRRAVYLPEELPSLLGPERAAAGLAGYDAIAHAERVAASAAEPWLAVQKLESELYLRHQLLRDADWASMAHSVELRVPFVDARLSAQLAASGFEPARTQGKAALVRRLAPELPEACFGRRKTGFSVPLPGLRDGESRGARSRRLARELVARWLPGADLLERAR